MPTPADNTDMARPTDQALVFDQARAGLDPSGFDPSRWSQGCAELVEWWNTGILPRGLIYHRAQSPAAPWAEFEGDSPRRAEQEFMRELVKAVAATCKEGDRP